MSNKTLRQTTRILHFMGAAFIGAFVYGPWGDGSTLEAINQFVIIPALTISGILLWQQPRVMKLFRRSRAN
ncbi:MAG: hypothetical protein AAGD96_11935 [Chloroflexota bacterium]